MAELLPYASRTGTRRNLAALRAANWRLLVSAEGVHRTEGFEHYGIDDGAWTAFQQYLKGLRPAPILNKRKFIKVVVELGAGADFTVVPDIVAGGRASLELSLRWLSWVLKHCRRALIAVQDGMVAHDVAHLLGSQVGIFVGGTTEPRRGFPNGWKLDTMCGWADLARARGAWCHVGRVNSALRINKVALAGATSFDGTSASRYAVTLPDLDRATRQQFLVLPTAPGASNRKDRR